MRFSRRTAAAEPPHSQPEEPDDQDPQQQVSERFGGYRLDCSGRVGLMPGDAEGRHYRDHPDNDVDDAANDEA